MAQQYLQALGNAYIVLTVIVLGLALWLPKHAGVKAAVAILVLIVMGFPMLQGFQGLRQAQHDAVKQQTKVDIAYARFTERCKTAGNRIVRTVDNVEGVMLLKLRPPMSFAEEANPMWPGAAMAADASGESYIRTFIDEDWNTQVFDEKSRKMVDVLPRKPRPRYRYVDFVDASDNRRYRETVDYEPIDPKAGVPWARKREYKREVANGPPPRYAIDFVDIVDAEDRRMWIAGTTIRIID